MIYCKLHNILADAIVVAALNSYNICILGIDYMYYFPFCITNLTIYKF